MLNLCNGQHLHSNLLDSKADGIEVSYNACGVLSHIMFDGPDVWLMEEPRREAVMGKMWAAIQSWDVSSQRNINYRFWQQWLDLIIWNIWFVIEMNAVPSSTLISQVVWAHSTSPASESFACQPALGHVGAVQPGLSVSWVSSNKQTNKQKTVDWSRWEFLVFYVRLFLSLNFSAARKYCPLLIKEGGMSLLLNVLDQEGSQPKTKEMARYDWHFPSSEGFFFSCTNFSN